MILNFEGELGKRHFEFCFVGFILGGSMQEKKGMVTMRREVILFQKLESISELKPCGKKLANGEPDRQLNGGGKIEIDVNEYDILYSYMSVCPWQTGTPTKMALETLDWLQTCSHG